MCHGEARRQAQDRILIGEAPHRSLGPAASDRSSQRCAFTPSPFSVLPRGCEAAGVHGRLIFDLDPDEKLPWPEVVSPESDS